MTDPNPTGFYWFDLGLRLEAAQANAFIKLMDELRHLMGTIQSPDGALVLWLQTVFTPGTTALQELPEALMELRAFATSHSGDARGFAYPDSRWWLKYVPKPLPAPDQPIRPNVIDPLHPDVLLHTFKAYSMDVFEKRCVWFGSQTDQVPHFRQFSYAMDVTEFAKSPDGVPLRMKVYDDPANPVEGHSQMWVFCSMTQPSSELRSLWIYDSKDLSSTPPVPTVSQSSWISRALTALLSKFRRSS